MSRREAAGDRSHRPRDLEGGPRPQRPALTRIPSCAPPTVPVSRTHLSTPHSTLRIPHLESPCLHVVPLLAGTPSPVHVEIFFNQRQHGLHFGARCPRVQRAPQVRVQLLAGAEQRRGRYRAELAPLEIDARSPDHLAV